MPSSQQLQILLLEDNHIKRGARMVPFSGWNMPVQYEGILSEYEQTRTQSSVFDISYMGKFIIEGDLLESGLDRIVTMPLSDLAIKSSRYGCICNKEGGIIDDTIVFRMEDQKWFVVVNASRIEENERHFKERLTGNVVFRNVSHTMGKIDIQGPMARDVLKEVVPGVENLSYFQFDLFTVLGGENTIISRTGYTGELGYEIFCPCENLEKLWNILLNDERVKPAGLGARDILRLEVGYSLYGHELDEHITPLQAGLKSFVDFDKDFIGRQALLQELKQGSNKKIRGFISDSRRSARSGQDIFSESGALIGNVTSACFSPSVGKGIGLAYVDSLDLKLGDRIFFGDQQKNFPARISKRIFYKEGSVIS